MLTPMLVIWDEEYGMTAYSDIKMSSSTTGICTLLAPLLITIPLFILHFVGSIEKRLGIIMALTTLFSIWSVNIESVFHHSHETLVLCLSRRQRPWTYSQRPPHLLPFE